MEELDKLERYLKEHEYCYIREDDDSHYMNKHQIIVFDSESQRVWDAICHRGSYGYEQGLLEIMGTIVDNKECDSVEGYLTAEDIIKRLEAQK